MSNRARRLSLVPLRLFISIQCPNSTKVTSMAAASKKVSSPTIVSSTLASQAASTPVATSTAMLSVAAPERRVGAADEHPARVPDDRRRQHQHQPVARRLGLEQLDPEGVDRHGREQHHRDRQRQRHEEAVAHVALHRRGHGRIGHVVRHAAVAVVRGLVGRIPMLFLARRVCGSSYCMRSHLVPQVIGAICAACASCPVDRPAAVALAAVSDPPHGLAYVLPVERRAVGAHGEPAGRKVQRGVHDPGEPLDRLDHVVRAAHALQVQDPHRQISAGWLLAHGLNRDDPLRDGNRYVLFAIARRDRRDLIRPAPSTERPELKERLQNRKAIACP